MPVSGVNCERGENMLVLYNEYYDTNTGTNEYGIEYVKKGKLPVEEYEMLYKEEYPESKNQNMYHDF